MSNEKKKWSILDGIELSDPEEMEELEALGALIDGPSYTLDGKEVTSNGSSEYYWFSRAEGSKSPIDYFVNVHGMGFQEAARTVLEAIHRDVTYTAPVWQPPAGHEELHPLPRAKTNLDAYNYLVRDRGLDEELVDELMRQGRIYQSDKYKNVVFVGTDFDGVVASNFARSCDPTQQVQRFDVRGSQKEYRFRMENPDCPRCNVFESEIDLLSYLSMRPADQRTENYIALAVYRPVRCWPSSSTARTSARSTSAPMATGPVSSVPRASALCWRVSMRYPVRRRPSERTGTSHWYASGS